jgi:hypothetical protein
MRGKVVAYCDSFRRPEGGRGLIYDDRIDPSTIGEFTCPTCFESFLALFLFLKHRRESHADKLAPLAGLSRKESVDA